MDAGSDKTAPSPMELLLVASAAARQSDVVTILRKKREPFTSPEVRAEADRAPTPPRVFTTIRLTYRVGGGVRKKRPRMRSGFRGKILLGFRHVWKRRRQLPCHRVCLKLACSLLRGFGTLTA